jgi:hypothetical protein
VSDFSLMCDAIIEDLVDNVPTLAVEPEAIHRYFPANPELSLNDGARHLAVFPAADEPDRSEPLTMGAHQLNQLYVLLVWEDASLDSRGFSDEEATATFLDLHNAIRARFYIQANQGRAGAFRVWYNGAGLPRRSSQVRYFEMEIGVATAVAFT